MTTIKHQITEMSHGPEAITPENVIYWSTHFEELKGEGYAAKAHKFLLYHSIIYVGDDEVFNSKYTWLVLPLNEDDTVEEKGKVFKKKPFTTNYNSTIYRIRNERRRLKCNCQGWHAKENKGAGREDGCQCSHVLALMLYFKLSNDEKDKYWKFGEDT